MNLMSCIAAMVREMNAGFFAPDFEYERLPELLVGEPPLRDDLILADGRTWLRVYLDGSSLDSNGTVRMDAPELLAA